MAKISGSKESSSLLWLILGIALLLRLNNLTGFSLSNDELSALARLQFDSVGKVIRDGVYVDFHPAGVQVFLYYWTKLFGLSEFMIRLPFALMGVLSVFFLYLIGKRWFGLPTGLLAAASLAVLEFPLLYSQIARPYSPGLLAALMATYFWTKVVFNTKEEKNYRDYAGFILSVSACMYIHYFSFIFAGLLCFTGLFFMKRVLIIPYLLCGVFIALLYIPHFDILIHQLSKGGVGGADGWLGPPKPDAFSKYLNYSFNDSEKLKALFYIVVLGSILAFRGSFKLSKFHLLAVLFYAIPIAVAYFYSIYKNPVFQYSVLLFSFPFLLLFIFSFIPRDKSGFTLLFLLFIVITAGAYSTITEKKYYTTAHFTEFREIAKKIKSIDDKLGVNNVTRTISVFDPYYINYYLEKYDHPEKFEIYGIFSREDKQNFYRIIEESTRPYFLFAYSNVYVEPEFDLVIRSQFPWRILKDSMLGSGLILYSKNRVDTALNRLPGLELNNSFENGKWDNEQSYIDSVTKYQGSYAIHLNSDSEYGPTFQKQLKEILVSPGSKLEISAAMLTTGDSINAKLVVSVEKDGKTIYWNGVSAADYFREQGSWFRMFMVAQIPPDISGDEIIKIYLWNEKKEKVWIDDVRINIYFPD